MSDSFEYDVFLSFSSADAEAVRPTWQHLCKNGLRVFWSDTTLRTEMGRAWFDVIENSLERSRHLVLFCTARALQSEWVKREYKAFYNHCYRPNERRLVPALIDGFNVGELPLFLRDLQVADLRVLEGVSTLLHVLGDTTISDLRKNLRERESEVLQLRALVDELRADLQAKASVSSNGADRRTIAHLRQRVTELEKRIFQEGLSWCEHDDER